ncbi:MAG: hypothetical protein WCJ97_02755, partial [Phycisphaerae bacterium]
MKDPETPTEALSVQASFLADLSPAAAAPIPEPQPQTDAAPTVPTAWSPPHQVEANAPRPANPGLRPPTLRQSFSRQSASRHSFRPGTKRVGQGFSVPDSLIPSEETANAGRNAPAPVVQEEKAPVVKAPVQNPPQPRPPRRQEPAETRRRQQPPQQREPITPAAASPLLPKTAPVAPGEPETTTPQPPRERR